MARKGCVLTCTLLCTDVAAIWLGNKVIEEGSFTSDASSEGSRVVVAKIPWLRGRKGGGDCSSVFLPPLEDETWLHSLRPQKNWQIFFLPD